MCVVSDVFGWFYSIITAPTISNWLTSIGTIILAFVAVFQDRIRARVWKPDLKVSIDMDMPDCYYDSMDFETYKFRLRIINTGKRKAELVEVVAEKLLEKKKNGSFEKFKWFLPENLSWSQTSKPFFEIISPGMEKHIDLGYIYNPKHRDISNFFELMVGRGFTFEENILQSPNKLDNDKTISHFCFSLETKKDYDFHCILPGIYHLAITIAAANASPIRKTLEINVGGSWFAEMGKMFTPEGVYIKVIQ